jgi:O-antigen/teichoic acid export membrane protein
MNKKNLTWFTLGSLASSSLSLISIPIIAWAFPEADIGKVALLISTSGLATLVLSLGLDQSFTREFNEAPDKAGLLVNATAPGAGLLLLVAAIAMLVAPTWPARVLFGESSARLSAFIFAYLIVVLVSRFFTLMLRMQEDGKRYALSFLLAKIAFVTLVLLAYKRQKPGLIDLLAAHGASVCVGLVFLMISIRSTLVQMKPAQFSVRVQKHLLSFGLPVATSGMLFWGLEGVDKFLLRSFSNYAQLGVYSIALSVSAMATMLTTMFTTVWIPVAYRWVTRKEDLTRIDDVTRHILAAVVLLSGFVGGFSWLLRFALPAQQAVVQQLVPACVLWPLFYALSETTGLGITITRSTRLGLIAAAVALATNVILNLILLPVFGSRGAAATLAISIWVFFVMKTEISHRQWRRIPRRSLYGWTLATLALAVVHALLGAQAGAPIVGLWLGYLVGAAIVFHDSLRLGFDTGLSMIDRRRIAPSS